MAKQTEPQHRLLQPCPPRLTSSAPPGIYPSSSPAHGCLPAHSLPSASLPTVPCNGSLLSFYFFPPRSSRVGGIWHQKYDQEPAQILLTAAQAIISADHRVWYRIWLWLLCSWGQRSCSVKSQILTMLGFAGRTVSVAAAEQCRSIKAAKTICKWRGMAGFQ